MPVPSSDKIYIKRINVLSFDPGATRTLTPYGDGFRVRSVGQFQHRIVTVYLLTSFALGIQMEAEAEYDSAQALDVFGV